MKQILGKFTLRSIFISLCLAVMGVIIIANANDVLFWVIKAIGVFLLIDAFIRLILFLRLDADEKSINFDIIRAIIETVIAIVALVNSSSVVALLYFFIGVIVIIEGILHLQFVLTNRGCLTHWLLNFFIAVINILCGVFIIANPILASKAVNIIIGIEIIVSSVFGMISYIYLYFTLRKVSVTTIDIEDVREIEE